MDIGGTLNPMVSDSPDTAHWAARRGTVAHESEQGVVGRQSVKGRLVSGRLSVVVRVKVWKGAQQTSLVGQAESWRVVASLQVSLTRFEAGTSSWGAVARSGSE